MHKILTLVAVPAVLSVALVAPTAMAARPSSATLTVSTSSTGAQATSQPTVGSSLVFSGCGYQPGVDIGVSVVSPTATTFIGEVAGSDGCFSTSGTAFPTYDAGTYKASAFQSSKRKADATVTFTVAQ
jgi:hypothetical protein